VKTWGRAGQGGGCAGGVGGRSRRDGRGGAGLGEASGPLHARPCRRRRGCRPRAGALGRPEAAHLDAGPRHRGVGKLWGRRRRGLWRRARLGRGRRRRLLVLKDGVASLQLRLADRGAARRALLDARQAHARGRRAGRERRAAGVAPGRREPRARERARAAAGGGRQQRAAPGRRRGALAAVVVAVVDGERDHRARRAVGAARAKPAARRGVGRDGHDAADEARAHGRGPLEERDGVGVTLDDAGDDAGRAGAEGVVGGRQPQRAGRAGGVGGARRAERGGRPHARGPRDAGARELERRAAAGGPLERG
jgi:hypothetical protein